MLIFRSSRVSSKFVRLETWSTVLRLLLNLFCSSTKTSLRVNHLSNLSFKIGQYLVCGRCQSNSSIRKRVSRIGCIRLSNRIYNALTPVRWNNARCIKTLNNMCKNETDASFRKHVRRYLIYSASFFLFSLKKCLMHL